MLDTIEVKNLKCFAHQIIPFGALTLFTGFNAAGKSTIIQTLLLGSQMVRNGHDFEAIPLNGDLVQLGTTGDVLCSYASKREIEIIFSQDDSDLVLRLDASQTQHSSLKLLNKPNLDSHQAILSQLGNVVYISAMRQGTKDVFPVHEGSHPVFADVGAEGQYAPWWFNHYDDDIDPARANPNESALTLSRQFNAWANEIFPGSEANTIDIERTTLVRLELRMGKQQAWSRPANIGYGLTYAFPILVAGLIIKPGQILIIDSPEAHLHPMGQSKIGYFLGIIAASGVQVVLETHSDHVLNGVRLAVAAKKIAPDKVDIHFFSSGGQLNNAPMITSPQLDGKGSLSEWPDGFFDQTDKDLSRLSGWA